MSQITPAQWASRPRPVFPARSEPLRPSRGPGPLMSACSDLSNQSATALALLLVPGVEWDLSESDEEGKGLLQVSVGKLHAELGETQAAGNAREQVFAFLLNAGVDPWVLDAQGVCPLREAVRKGDAPFLRAYAQSPWGQQPWVEPPKGQIDPKEWHRFMHMHLNEDSAETKALFADSVRERSKYGRAACIEVLASMGAPVDTPDDKGVRPLHLAKKASAVAALLAAGADPFSVDDSGRSAQDAIRSIEDQTERATALSAWTLSAATWSASSATPSDSDSGAPSRGASLPGKGLTDVQKRHLSFFEAIGRSDSRYTVDPRSFSQLWAPTDAAFVNERSVDGRLLLCQAVLAQDWKSVSCLMRAGADPFLTESAGGSAFAALCHLPPKERNRSSIPHFGVGRSFATQVFVEFLNRQWKQIEQAAGVPLSTPFPQTISAAKKQFEGSSSRTGPLFEADYDWTSLPREAFQSSQELGMAFACICNPAQHYGRPLYFSDAVKQALDLPSVLDDTTYSYRLGQAFLDPSSTRSRTDAPPARYPSWFMKAIGTHVVLAMEPVLNAICIQGVAQSASLPSMKHAHSSSNIERHFSPIYFYEMTASQKSQFALLDRSPVGERNAFVRQVQTQQRWLPDLCAALLPAALTASIHDYHSGLCSEWPTLAEEMAAPDLMKVAAAMAHSPALTHAPTAKRWASKFPLLFSACEAQVLRAPLQSKPRPSTLPDATTVESESLSTEDTASIHPAKKISRRL